MSLPQVKKEWLGTCWRLTAQASGRVAVEVHLYQRSKPTRAQLEEVASAAQKAPHLKGGES